MLINLSNHPSANWPKDQIQAAKKQFGEIVDLSFPQVSPDGDEKYIENLAQEYLQKIKEIAIQARNDGVTIHIMGEMTFTYTLIRLLQNCDFICIASTTKRIAKEEAGVKTSEFRFKRFRQYPNF